MQQSISRIARCSVALRGLTVLAMAATLLSILYTSFVIGFGTANQMLPDDLASLIQPAGKALGRGHIALVALAGVPATLAMLWTLWQAQALFAAYATGAILTERTSRLILRIGSGLMLIAALGPTLGALQSVVVSAANPAGQRTLAIGISNADLWLLLAGGLMTVIGWIMLEATAIAEDNKGFV